MFWVMASITLVLVVLTALPLSRSEAWWVRSLDFPRLQLAVALLLVLATDLVVLDLTRLAHWTLIGVAAASLAYHAWWIVPYTRAHPLEVKDADERDREVLRIMVSNVLMSNRNADALLGMIREFQPDLVVTLESDAWWQAQLDVLQGAYPHTIKCPRDNRYGMHVYSKLALTDAGIEYLVEDSVPSMHAMLSLRSGQRVRLHCLHPKPPGPTEKATSEPRDAELVIVARSVAGSDLPVIVTGDLNDVAWSATTRLFRKISGLLDPRIGRGMFNTFHAEHWFMRWPLDHLFHSAQFKLKSLRRLPGYGSDHFPLLTELVFTRGAKPQQDGLDADADDRARATDIARRQRVDAGDVPVPGN